jgi:hypothetical protein
MQTVTRIIILICKIVGYLTHNYKSLPDFTTAAVLKQEIIIIIKKG